MRTKVLLLESRSGREPLSSEVCRRLRSNPSYDVEAPGLGLPKGVGLGQGSHRLDLPLTREAYLEALETAIIYRMDFQPDVVIGSGPYGGGLVALLAAEGYYTGPLIMLRPAPRLFEVDRIHHHSSRAVVIHNHSLSSFSDTEQMVARSGSNFFLLSLNDDEELHKTLENGYLEEAINHVLRVPDAALVH